jgi:hypothetical protein
MEKKWHHFEQARDDLQDERTPLANFNRPTVHHLKRETPKLHRFSKVPNKPPPEEMINLGGELPPLPPPIPTRIKTLSDYQPGPI